MKGFIRAKGLDEWQHPTAAGNESHTEQGVLADDHVSGKRKRSSAKWPNPLTIFDRAEVRSSRNVKQLSTSNSEGAQINECNRNS
jgi:hypothetical protein